MSSRDLTETPRFSTRPRSIEAPDLQRLTLLRFKPAALHALHQIITWSNTEYSTPPACSPRAEWGTTRTGSCYPQPRTGLQFPSRNVHAWHGCKWDAIIIRYPNPVLGFVHPACCCLSSRWQGTNKSGPFIIGETPVHSAQDQEPDPIFCPLAILFFLPPILGIALYGLFRVAGGGRCSHPLVHTTCDTASISVKTA